MASTCVASKCRAAASAASRQSCRLCSSSGARLSLQPGRSGSNESYPAASRRRIVSTVKRRSLLASSNRAGRTRMRRSRLRSNAMASSAPSGPGQETIIGASAAVELRRHEAEKGAVSLEHLAVDFVVLDDDREAVLYFGQQSCDGHRIEFGEVAEQTRIGGEICGPIGAEAEHVPQHLAQNQGGFEIIADGDQI